LAINSTWVIDDDTVRAERPKIMKHAAWAASVIEAVLAADRTMPADLDDECEECDDVERAEAFA